MSQTNCTWEASLRCDEALSDDDMADDERRTRREGGGKAAGDSHCRGCGRCVEWHARRAAARRRFGLLPSRDARIAAERGFRGKISGRIRTS